ncbi:MAG: flagellar assembly protein FliH [Betaproteobacteria bacterium]|nr:flagellar assembly protein FliH [Betaproteobacteria bacterium]
MIIPKESAGKARAWAAPELGSGAPREAGRGASAGVPGTPGGPPLPTARDLEAVFEAAREQGRREGFEQGYQEGRAGGLQAGRQQAQAELESVRALLQRLGTAAAALDAELEASLVALAMELARQVIVHELRTQPQQVLDVLQKALAAFPARAGVPWVRLHPDDAALLGELAPELEESGMGLVADPTLQRGDLVLGAGPEGSRAHPERRWRVRDAQAELDLRLEERWRQVMARLFEEGSL